jgi:glutamate-1-semialdehyde 2,1-aminomutase
VRWSAVPARSDRRSIPALTTRVVPFNDLDALDAALAHGDVAAVLMEPALTNIGIVLPRPGYHDAVREITRRHGCC